MFRSLDLRATSLAIRQSEEPEADCTLSQGISMLVTHWLRPVSYLICEHYLSLQRGLLRLWDSFKNHEITPLRPTRPFILGQSLGMSNSLASSAEPRKTFVVSDLKCVHTAVYVSVFGPNLEWGGSSFLNV